MKRASEDGAVYVGATGHRFLADRDGLEAAASEALDQVQRRFGDRPLTVLSPLAEGADRLIAKEVLRRPGSTLIVPLPLPYAEYLNDFEDDASKQEFSMLLARAKEIVQLTASPSRDEAYMAAGRYVADYCQVLLAMWDGRGEQGTGGTALVVARARRRGVPLVWVHTGNRRHGGAEATSLGAEQGLVTYENF